MRKWKFLIQTIARICVFLFVFCYGASAEEVDVAVVLAADVSASVGNEAVEQQRQAHANALRSPEVIGAVMMGVRGCAGFAYFEWSSNGRKRVLLPWTRICGPADAEDAARRIVAGPGKGRRVGGRTSVSFAIAAAAALLANSPWRSDRTIIDIAANGFNNDGPSLADSRAGAIAAGQTINAVALPGPDSGSLTDYLAGQVIGGPGAFVIESDQGRGFSVALRRKLVTEIAAAPPGRVRATAVRTASLARPAPWLP